MRKFFLIGVLLVLGAVAFWLIKEQNSTSSSKDAFRTFHIEDAGEVHRIFLADRDRNQIDLKKQKDHWSLNEKYMARPWVIDAFLNTLESMRIKYIPTKAAVKQVIPEMASHGRKVELFNKKNQKIMSFYVGGTTNDETGTYMMMEGSNQVYVTHIPGWVGELRTRFHTNLSDWRDKALFKERPEDIVEVKVNYPMNRSKSFILNRSGKGYEVQPMYPTTPGVSSEIVQGLADAYLMGFETLYAEAFENGNSRKDSVIQTLSFCTIELSRADESTLKVDLYPVRDKDKEAIQPDYHIHRYFANRSDGDFLLVQYGNLKEVLWGYDAFFQ